MVSRFDRLDALRGLAIVWMAGFHLAFDLNHLGLLEPAQNFYRDPLWTVQRACIVSLFLFCAGLSLACALEAGQAWPRFWRRWAQVAGCAVLVSLGSALMFPGSWISFGVLHAIAAMLLLARLAATWLPRPSAMGPVRVLTLLALAGVAWALPQLVQHPVFDNRLLNPLGLVTAKPRTEDYVPLLPWLAPLLVGWAAGGVLLARAPQALAGGVPRAMRPLAGLGRWSLSFYMLHQPVFIGVLMAGRSFGAW
ncbi:MAG: DUF1624 domain-containing protein [Rubrivivax sp.]|jgi:uncharacterized membrane protein|nr:DUF1624 domain-containing protein [Rubrivivax sp.]